MIKLWKNGLEIRLNDEKGEKLKVNLQQTKNNGLGAPVVNIEKLTNGGKKWYSLSKLKEGLNEINDLDKAERSYNGVSKSSKVSKIEDYLNEKELKKYNECLEVVNKYREIVNKRKEEESLVDDFMSGKLKIEDIDKNQKEFIMSKINDMLNRLK